ncbi:RNA polymerase sigma factor [Acidisoma silvae]|uniref:Sigma-70 family RNA polymerase sigma factor n=1 Tax=Acidisoma silvae TaxID=2802396 RepID=A0A963YV44_9PROT|nr:sigma-70 family RNA polymerase sigma factor [Acidisoma silvae]MCB8877672.1 sigma-70 family RNA polymerase sigma factor [Acidisoma silvae]
MSVRDLGRLFLAHQREILSYLMVRLRDREMAADLTQDTFLRYAEQAGRAVILHERSYLYRTAHNLAIDHMRQVERRQTESVPHEALAEIPGQTANPEEAFAARQRVDQLRRVIAELPRRTQEVFALNRLEDLTYPEVARRLGISESSVQKHLSRALQHLMHRLEL